MKINFKEALAKLQATLGIKTPETSAVQTATTTTEPPATTDNPPVANNDARIAALEVQLQAQNQALMVFMQSATDLESENEALKTQSTADKTKIKELEKGPGATPTVATDANADPLNNAQGGKREPTKFELEVQALVEANTYADKQIELYKKVGIL